MTDPNSSANRHIKALAGVMLAASLLLVQPVWNPAGADVTKKPAKAWPMRDFLPPVANINPKMDPNQAANGGDDTDIEPVDLHAVTTQALRTKPKVERLAGEIDGLKSEGLQTILDIQKKVDEADLERLWQATVEKNPVIRFSLEKLATPVDLQSKQSSRFLTKSISTLISGAGLATSMIPGVSNSYMNMGSAAVGNALQNMMNGRTQLPPGTLSATEQIQMAGLIDDLKMKLIHTYQDYKTTLQALSEAHALTVKNNNLYSKALASKNDVTIMVTGTAYYQSLGSETALRQKAKLFRLQLERLAGQEVVSNMELVAHVGNPTTSDVSDTDGSETPAQTKPLELGEEAKPVAEPVQSQAAMIGPEVPVKVQTAAIRERTSSKKAAEPVKPQAMIGPEPETKAGTESTPSKSTAMPLELPQAMEIGPSLRADIHLPTPLPSLPPANNTRKTLAQNKYPTNSSGLEPLEVLDP